MENLQFGFIPNMFNSPRYLVNLDFLGKFGDQDIEVSGCQVELIAVFV